MKKYLVYDAYGTLLQVNSTLPGLPAAEQALSEKIQALWRTKQLEYTWLNSLMGRFEGFNQVTLEALDYAFAYYKANNPTLRQAILSIFDAPTAFADAQRFLGLCKAAGAQNAILSNGEPDKLQESARIAGIASSLHHVLSASQVQVFKPSPRVYQLAVSLYGCQPREVTFFSSNPWDVAGAKTYGFTVVWINRKGLPADNLGVKPDFEFSSFDDFSLSDLG